MTIFATFQRLEIDVKLLLYKGRKAKNFFAFFSFLEFSQYKKCLKMLKKAKKN